MNDELIEKQVGETEIVNSRQAQEVQAAMVVAKKFPRDEIEAERKIKNACKRKGLAEQAEYLYPRGGQKVTGASIRLAETIAQYWGNIDYGILELNQKNGYSEMMAYAWDLETNTRRTMVFTVKHERKASGKINKLDDARDIYEMTANMGARRVRACILAVVPGDVVDMAIEQCRLTLKSGHEKPFVDRVKDMFSKFDEFQVTIEMIEDFCGYNKESFSEQDLIKLGAAYKSLKDGMAKRDDFFKVKKTNQKATSSLDGVIETKGE